jgi:hypothetical protein
MCLVEGALLGISNRLLRAFLASRRPPLRSVFLADTERSKNGRGHLLRIGWMLISFLPGRNRCPAPRFNCEPRLRAAMQWPFVLIVSLSARSSSEMPRQRFLGTCFNDTLVVESLPALRVMSGLPDTQNKSPAGKKGISSLSKARAGSPRPARRQRARDWGKRSRSYAAAHPGLTKRAPRFTRGGVSKPLRLDVTSR